MFKNWLPELRRRSLETSRPTSIADLMEEFWKEPLKAFDDFPAFRGMGYPAVNVAEDDKRVTVTAELPGVDPKEIEVTLERGVLTIRGEKKFEDEEKKDNYHRIERSYGSFSRSVSLPRPVKEDEVKASYKDGVLTIEMPLAEEAKARKIAIQS
ncbi:heat shock protein Hsp20 [Alkalidesulfovibrio alkalitolerans DSM 16529]|uniref:Heat shock protein Hsp20 n=1 Tax=Alkalidesulfovibrio alkalitolerans DSM 16529 TaxID=1121439 RepID=S7TEQ4_9BACT|nr:Hsp20/alpha crystallin family protein [Alkalidesulfovibrio alkalitolerans]EPR35667.1 heat shock protein Hsp20 [Alkalidesulfovibrio alkalitolerans DSM 16529]